MFQMAFFEPYIFSKLHAKNVPSKKICSCLFSNSLTKILNLRDSSQQLKVSWPQPAATGPSMGGLRGSEWRPRGVRDFLVLVPGILGRSLLTLPVWGLRHERSLRYGSPRPGSRGRRPTPGQAQEKQEAVTPDFVAKCSNVREKGDGLLHSALFRGRFVYVPECRQWYDMSAKILIQNSFSPIPRNKDNIVPTQSFRMCQMLFFRHKKTPFCMDDSLNNFVLSKRCFLGITDLWSHH